MNGILRLRLLSATGEQTIQRRDRRKVSKAKGELRTSSVSHSTGAQLLLPKIKTLNGRDGVGTGDCL